MNSITNVTPAIKLTEWEGSINFDVAQSLAITEWDMSIPSEIFEHCIMKYLDGKSFANLALTSRAFRVVALQLIGGEYAQEISFMDQMINRFVQSEEDKILQTPIYIQSQKQGLETVMKIRSLKTNLTMIRSREMSLANLWPLNEGISFLKFRIVQELSTIEVRELSQYFHTIAPPLSFNDVYIASIAYGNVRNPLYGSYYFFKAALGRLVETGYDDVALKQAYLTEDEELRDSMFYEIAATLIDLKKYDRVPEAMENISNESLRTEVDTLLAKSLAEGSDYC